MSEIDLSKVSVEEIMAEIKRRKKQNTSQSCVATNNANDFMAPIGDTASKTNQQAVEDKRTRVLEEEKRQLEDEIRRKKIEQQVMALHHEVDRDMEEMEKEHKRMRAEAKAFHEECHRRIVATSTNEQLSLFPWFKK